MHGMMKLASTEEVEGLDISPSTIKRDFNQHCEVCSAGKQTRLPFSNHKATRSTRPLELVHSDDICGPISPTTWGNKRYFMTVIDDFTHFTMVFLLSNKSEVVKHLIEYEAQTSAKFNAKIARFRCDNGGEYISKEFVTFCKSKGIALEHTVPYTPQLNGVAERQYRTLLEKARCMIFNSNLDKKLWGESVLTAASVQ